MTKSLAYIFLILSGADNNSLRILMVDRFEFTAYTYNIHRRVDVMNMETILRAELVSIYIYIF